MPGPLSNCQWCFCFEPQGFLRSQGKQMIIHEQVQTRSEKKLPPPSNFQPAGDRSWWVDSWASLFSGGTVLRCLSEGSPWYWTLVTFSGNQPSNLTFTGFSPSPLSFPHPHLFPKITSQVSNCTNPCFRLCFPRSSTQDECLVRARYYAKYFYDWLT